MVRPHQADGRRGSSLPLIVFHCALRFTLARLERSPLLALGAQARVGRWWCMPTQGERGTHGGWGVVMARWVVRRSLIPSSSSAGSQSSARHPSHSMPRVRGPRTNAAQSVHERLSLHLVQEKDAASDRHPVQHVPPAPVTRGPVGVKLRAPSRQKARKTTRAHDGAGWGGWVQVWPRPRGP